MSEKAICMIFPTEAVKDNFYREVLKFPSSWRDYFCETKDVPSWRSRRIGGLLSHPRFCAFPPPPTRLRFSTSPHWAFVKQGNKLGLPVLVFGSTPQCPWMAFPGPAFFMLASQLAGTILSTSYRSPRPRCHIFNSIICLGVCNIPQRFGATGHYFQRSCDNSTSLPCSASFSHAAAILCAPHGARNPMAILDLVRSSAAIQLQSWRLWRSAGKLERSGSSLRGFKSLDTIMCCLDAKVGLNTIMCCLDTTRSDLDTTNWLPGHHKCCLDAEIVCTGIVFAAQALYLLHTHDLGVKDVNLATLMGCWMVYWLAGWSRGPQES